MASRFIAIVALLGLSVLNTLGNFWFTYGIWPRSWGAFAFFGFSTLCIYGLMSVVNKDEKAHASGR